MHARRQPGPNSYSRGKRGALLSASPQITFFGSWGQSLETGLALCAASYFYSPLFFVCFVFSQGLRFFHRAAGVVPYFNTSLGCLRLGAQVTVLVEILLLLLFCFLRYFTCTAVTKLDSRSLVSSTRGSMFPQMSLKAGLVPQLIIS